MTSAVTKHPLILWAQRSPHLYLSVEVGDMKVEELVIQDDKFKIRGVKGDDKYEADLELFGKLKGGEERKIKTDRRVEFVIPKEKEEWWPRLLKEKTKVPWIKVDFDKWKDEDEEKEAEDGAFGGMDFSSFGLPSGGRGYDDMDLGDDEGDDDMGDLEELSDDESSKKPEENGEVNKTESAPSAASVSDEKPSSSTE